MASDNICCEAGQWYKFLMALIDVSFVGNPAAAW